jgi:glycosyltransferase involved in cell wall biosynthesis
VKIIFALPRRMRFEARAASSVELCVSEWVSGSKYRSRATVFAERSNEPPLLEVDIYRLRPSPRLSSWQLAVSIMRQIGAHGYNMIITQQHIPTAARIATVNYSTPTILQTHNFIDPPATGRAARLVNAIRFRELQSLSGITFVSNTTRTQFERDWPDVTVARAVVSNGIEGSQWQPREAREKRILVVGRCRDEKGILEAAQGAATFLSGARDWRASFILSEVNGDEVYFARVKDALRTVSGQAEILHGIPFAVVKRMTESAAISVVASKWQEPFGRTALEAHAGGAALISSGTGGLREISGDGALYLESVSAPAIYRALCHLAHDEQLQRSLAASAAERVHRLFLLRSDESHGDWSSICGRLDNFIDEVAARTKRMAQ